MPQPNDDRTVSANTRSSVMRQLAPYMVLGTQLAAAVLVLGGAGWLIDDHLGSDPWGLVVGLCVGSVVGFYQFLRSVQQLLVRDTEQRTKEGNPWTSKDHS